MSRKRGSNAEIKVGDIYYSSWGYDQTNIDYYEVTNKRGKTQLVIKKLEQETREEGFMQGPTVPVPGSGNGPGRVVSLGEEGSFKVSSFAWAYPWDGEPKRCSWYA